MYTIHRMIKINNNLTEVNIIPVFDMTVIADPFKILFLLFFF